MKYLRKLLDGLDVDPVVGDLAAHPELWNQYKLRTALYAGPHSDVSDIWLRFRAWSDFDQNGGPEAIAKFVGEPHESVWYEAIDKLPSVRTLVFEMVRHFEVERLGGVLITKIPAGSEVKPHQDHGHHATFYEKLAVQIKSAPGQAFCYEDGAFECEPGTVYTFCNQETHGVVNKSTEERITLIIAVRRDQRLKPLYVGE